MFQLNTSQRTGAQQITAVHLLIALLFATGITCLLSPIAQQVMSRETEHLTWDCSITLGLFPLLSVTEYKQGWHADRFCTPKSWGSCTEILLVHVPKLMRRSP